jgi:phosphoribosylformylglycinamidine synthase
MRTRWEDVSGARSVTAPVSLVVSAFAPVSDVRGTLTPELSRDEPSVLIFVDLAGGRQRLGGSCLAQCHGTFGGEPADLDDPQSLLDFFDALRALRDAGLVLAYHDRSDGGLIVTLLEMAFASKLGLDIEVPAGTGPLPFLLNEELGAVLQVRRSDFDRVDEILGSNSCRHFLIAEPVDGPDITISQGDHQLMHRRRVDFHARWSELTFRMQALRDNPDCAREAYESTLDDDDPGLNVALTFPLPREDDPARRKRPGRPAVAILREQGVNGQREMAAALDRAGFDTHDVHMSDLLARRTDLGSFGGLIACGGFSYGDVLGAGEGWAKSILYNAAVREEFERFFARDDTFALGVCNGCQMLAALKDLIPGAEQWPRFVRNRSDQFEGRFSLVEVQESASVLLAGMAGSRLPVVTSHGEGRAEFADETMRVTADRNLSAIRYVDNRGRPTETYPANPNGSPAGLAGLTSVDGRVTIMMPHPERGYRTVQNSWHPDDWGECSPWQQLFDNARVWIDAL